MVAVGAHMSVMDGIGFHNDGEPLGTVATAVVMSGGYEDDEDSASTGDCIIYTGQGGNDMLGGRTQVIVHRIDWG